eukprot:TRINITY_DN16222_c0_g3_i1.p1 TRINITY_DN16222_c0_g3~~TRINITY_DN16222_c0_g3_i1.p1  ORF type:complete len:499 (+),score=99.05 TRINITY_DN16222_c0_g3_i1:92-1588(+)
MQDARERANVGRPGQYKATTTREAENDRRREALSFQQSDSRANRIADVRRIAMEALLGSDNQNDVAEEVEVEDDDDDAADDAMDTTDQGDHGRRRRRLRRLHRTLFFARQLQVPDWMLEPPEDLASSWMVLVRPEGDRCLLLSDGGRVEIRRKNGYVLERYKDSRFPRGLTILDCVCIETTPASSSTAPASTDDVVDMEEGGGMNGDETCDVADNGDDVDEESQVADSAMGCTGGYGGSGSSKGSGRGKSRGKGGKGGKGKGRRGRPQGDRTYAVCDVLWWGDQDMAGAEAECRLFWLESRFSEMDENHARRARPLKLVRSMPATPESLQEAYAADFGYAKDSLLFLHRAGHYQIGEPVTPLALQWRDKTLSRFVVDTPDEKGEELPQRQSVVLEVRGGCRLRTAERMLVAQCKEEEVPTSQGIGVKGTKHKILIRCEVQGVDIVNRCLENVVPVTHVAARSRCHPDSWGRIVFQHLHRVGQASALSFDVLLRASASG